MYCSPDVFIVDSGSHSLGHDITDWCESHGSKYQQVAAYLPWVNGLLKGTNGELLSHLKRLCAQNLGEDEWVEVTSSDQLLSN